MYVCLTTENQNTWRINMTIMINRESNITVGDYNTSVLLIDRSNRK